MLSIGFLAYEDMQALDLAGPLDVFGSAKPGAPQPGYRLHVIGLSTRSVKAENGLTFLPGCDIGSAPPLDTLLIPGGIGSRQSLSRNPELLEWLRSRAQDTRRIVSVCTGVFTLAAAGLLDGRRATTHWRYRDEFTRRFPRVHLVDAASAAWSARATAARHG